MDKKHKLVWQNMKNFKFKKIKVERPIKTFFASKGKKLDPIKIPRAIFWKVHEAKNIEFFHKKEEDEFYNQILTSENFSKIEWD